MPGAGFALRVGVLDEDAGRKDDRIGEARVSFFGRPSTNKHKAYSSEEDADADRGQVRDGLKVERKEAMIKNRRGGVRAYVATFAITAVNKKISRRGGYVMFSLEVMGLIEN